MFKISPAPLDPAALKQLLLDPHAGACVTFEGWVRDHNDGRSVRALDYEAFAELAEREGNRILDEARAKFDLVTAHCVHRVGSLHIGDLAVWTGVSAAHRGAAFDACRYIIDEAKARVPIWKKEHYVEGTSEWINCATRGDHVTSSVQR
jgi:Molybdopterin converting factor, large subunit